MLHKKAWQENTSSSKETSAFKTSRQMNSLTSCIHCLADKLLQDGDNVFLIFLLLKISYALEEFGRSNLFKSHCTSPCDVPALHWQKETKVPHFE